MKKSLKMLVNTIEKVKSFIDCNSRFDGNVDVVSSRYIINGKSIMGMFSLDLTDEIEVVIESDSEQDIESLIENYKATKLL